MRITKDSHLDHGLTPAQVEYISKLFASAEEFFIETITLPAELGLVPCGLYGPMMGDDDVQADIVRPRGDRAWPSKLVNRPMRPTHLVTIIAGPHDGEACILYTAFGGPQAPQEPGDPGCKNVELSERFWSKHALAI